MHVDTVNTHVVSAIINVDQQLDEEVSYVLLHIILHCTISLRQLCADSFTFPTLSSPHFYVSSHRHLPLLYFRPPSLTYALPMFLY
jgi:hypothetical protein